MKRYSLFLYLLILTGGWVFSSPGKAPAKIAIVAPGPLVALTNLNRISATETEGIYHLALPSQGVPPAESIGNNLVDDNLDHLNKALNRPLPPGAIAPFYWGPPAFPRTYLNSSPMDIYTVPELINIAINKCIIDEYILPKAIKKLRQTQSVSF